MANFHRLIFCFVLAVSAWLPASVFASFPGTSAPYYSAAGVCGAGAATGATAGVACGAAAAKYNNPPLYVKSTSATESLCTAVIWRSDTNKFVSNCTSVISIFSSSVCPANSTGTTTCTCNVGFTESSGACLSPLQSSKVVADGLNFVGAPLIGSGGGLKVCYGGYEMTSTGSATGTKAGVSSTEYYGPFTSAGTPCTATASVATGGAAACKTTEFYGSVNGVDTCVPATTTTGSSTSTVSPTPSGSASSPSSSVNPSAPPSATGETKSTTCESGQCTTTTKWTDSTGATVGTKEEKESEKSFCSENPKSTVCVESAITAASCSAAPACSGDAVQCFTAAQAFKTACALNPGVTQESQAYDSAKSITGDVTGSLPGNASTAFSSASFDQTELMGAAAGLSNFSVSVMGQSMLIDFTTLNLWLGRFGVLLQAVTALACLRIVMRG